MRSWMRRSLQGGALVGLVWGIFALSLDGYGHRGSHDVYDQRESHGVYDAIVVAGCRVNPDGQPSLALKRRTRKAIELWKRGIAPTIVFTGGVGGTPPSEAAAASDYARTLGLPSEAMILEERSTSTEENARYAADVLDPASHVVVVTDTYHVFRAERVFGKVFAEAKGVGSDPSLTVRARGALREVLAVSSYAARGRL